MNRHDVIKFSTTTKFMSSGDNIIVINRLHGLWVKIPKICKDMLTQCDEAKYTLGYLIDSLVDDEDREYMFKVINALEDIKVLGFQEENNRFHDVSLAITNRCNLQCNHCMVNADRCTDKENFTTDQIKSALDKMIEAKPEAITITGGEPLLRPDFIEIIKYLKSKFDGKIGLMTNGTLINESNVRDIINSVSSIDISLDGVDEESCSIIRGKNVFNKIIYGIELLKKYNFDRITTSMILTANNEPLVDKFFDLNNKLGIKGIIRQLSFVGKAKDNEKLLKTKFNNEEIAISDDVKQERFHTCCCSAGCKTLTIENDGSIFPCNLFIEEEHKLGNIMDIKSLNDVLVKDKKCFLSKSLQKYEPDLMKECKNCNVNYFCWSCLHQVIDFKENGTFEDRCAFMKKKLQNVYNQ